MHWHHDIKFLEVARRVKKLFGSFVLPWQRWAGNGGRGGKKHRWTINMYDIVSGSFLFLCSAILAYLGVCFVWGLRFWQFHAWSCLSLCCLWLAAVVPEWSLLQYILEIEVATISLYSSVVFLFWRCFVLFLRFLLLMKIAMFTMMVIMMFLRWFWLSVCCICSCRCRCAWPSCGCHAQRHDVASNALLLHCTRGIFDLRFL